MAVWVLVYLASQRVLKRTVALKVLRSGDSASVEERERLLRKSSRCRTQPSQYCPDPRILPFTKGSPISRWTL